jgi:hypothetical protein
MVVVTACAGTESERQAPRFAETGTQTVATVAPTLSLQLEHLVSEGRTNVGDVQATRSPFELTVENSAACQGPQAVRRRAVSAAFERTGREVRR